MRIEDTWIKRGGCCATDDPFLEGGGGSYSVRFKAKPWWPVALGIEQIETEVTLALRSMANAKVVAQDNLPVKLLKLGLNHDPSVLREFYRVTKLVWHERIVPQRWRYAVTKVLHKKDMGELGNYRDISLVAHRSKDPG